MGNFRLVAVLCCVFAGAGWVACSADSTRGIDVDPPSVASLLAVGDTGSEWGAFPGFFEGQLAVGAALQREHERHPVDALVLLGDNFYPNGLLKSELRSRIVQNVLRPYCVFVDPADSLASEAGRFCSRGRTPIPRLLAIVGNHDLLSPDSLTLQRYEVPRWVRNWDMPLEDGSVVRELPGGLSLILVLSEWPWGEEAIDGLSRALEEARGPWRVIVGHRPPISGHPQLSSMVAEASRRAGEVVHAYLAGHVHGLVAIPGSAPAPALTLIAGSGSHAKLQEETEYQIENAEVMVEELGFLRLDVVGDAASQRLRVALERARPSAALALLGTATIARYEIRRDGALERID